MHDERIWYHRRGLQWWRVLRVSLLWIGIVVVAVLLLQPREEPPVRDPAVLASADAASVARVSRPGFAPLVARSVAPPSAASAARVVAAASGGAVEVCGVGRVKPAASDPDGYAVLDEHRSPVELTSWLDSVISQAADERARAAALLMRGGQERLAQLAARSADPYVYAYAVQSCRAWDGPGRTGACRQVSPDGWARVDPTNAVPWLYAANAARQRGDAPAVAEAIQRASQATHHRNTSQTLVQSLFADDGRGLSRSQATLLLTDAVGTQAASAMPHLAVLHVECSEAAIAQPARREACSRIVERMVHDGDSLVDITVATRVGERLGWPKERIAGVRGQVQTLMHHAASEVRETRQLSCGNVEKLRRYMVSVGRVGERAAMLEQLAASGKTFEEADRRRRAQAAQTQ